jgi:hypothetical protein
MDEGGDEGGLERHRQAGLLRALAARIEEGDPLLPTHVLGPVERELELRRDDDAIEAAWREQGDKEAEAWVFARGRALG